MDAIVLVDYDPKEAASVRRFDEGKFAELTRTMLLKIEHDKIADFIDASIATAVAQEHELYLDAHRQNMKAALRIGELNERIAELEDKYSDLQNATLETSKESMSPLAIAEMRQGYEAKASELEALLAVTRGHLAKIKEYCIGNPCPNPIDICFIVNQALSIPSPSTALSRAKIEAGIAELENIYHWIFGQHEGLERMMAFDEVRVKLNERIAKLKEGI